MSTRLYCPKCSAYLEGGDGNCHDCSCGWKQPVEDFSEDNSRLRTENEDLRKQVADLQEALDNLAPYGKVEDGN